MWFPLGSRGSWLLCLGIRRPGNWQRENILKTEMAQAARARSHTVPRQEFHLKAHGRRPSLLLAARLAWNLLVLWS